MYLLFLSFLLYRSFYYCLISLRYLVPYFYRCHIYKLLCIAMLSHIIVVVLNYEDISNYLEIFLELYIFVRYYDIIIIFVQNQIDL